MKITEVFDLATVPVSFLSACDISRADEVETEHNPFWELAILKIRNVTEFSKKGD